MKKILTPAVLAIAVLAATLLTQKYSLYCQEYNGLFLASGDYFRQVLGFRFPLSELLGDWLCQFYSFHYVGAAVVAAFVVLVFVLLRSFLLRLGLHSESLALLPACISWYFISLAFSPARGVRFVLAALVLWVIGRFFRRREAKSALGKADLAIFAAVLAAGVSLVCVSPSVKRNEMWAKIEHGTAHGDWNMILETAGLPEIEKDRALLPYALLAQTMPGRIGERLISYPVTGSSDLYPEGNSAFMDFLFREALYNGLGSTNESVHNIFQGSTFMRHGTSFLMLRLLIVRHFNLGNYPLVEKYCRILDRSACNGAFTAYFRRLMSEGEPRPADSMSKSSGNRMVTNNHLYNIMLLGSMGIGTAISDDLIVCTHLLERNLEAFKNYCAVFADGYESLPVHYQEAMLMAGIESDKISPEVRAAYRNFLQSSVLGDAGTLSETFKGTFWLYFISRPADGSRP